MAIVDSRMKAGTYDNLVDTIETVLPSLVSRPSPQVSTRKEHENEDAGTVATAQKRRLDADRLLAHYRDNGQEQTFLSQPCDLVLALKILKELPKR